MASEFTKEEAAMILELLSKNAVPFGLENSLETLQRGNSIIEKCKEIIDRKPLASAAKGKEKAG